MAESLPTVRYCELMPDGDALECVDTGVQYRANAAQIIGLPERSPLVESRMEGLSGRVLAPNVRAFIGAFLVSGHDVRSDLLAVAHIVGDENTMLPFLPSTEASLVIQPAGIHPEIIRGLLEHAAQCLGINISAEFLSSLVTSTFDINRLVYLRRYDPKFAELQIPALLYELKDKAAI